MSEYISRLVDQRLADLMTELPAIMIVGPRAIGKTTTVSRVAQAVVRLDRETDAEPFRADPDTLLAQLASPALIDEWQMVPEVLPAIKRSIDEDSRPGRYVVTGSVRADLLEASWAATGRIVRINQWGLTQREILGDLERASFFDRVRDGDNSLVGSEGAGDLASYVDTALNSGFPEAVGLSERARREWLLGYVDQIVLRDAASLGSRRDTTRLRRLLVALAASTAGLVTDKSLHDAAGVTRTTGVAYETALEMLYVVDRIPAWHSNRVKRLVRSPKRMLVEPALVGALLGVDRSAILQDGDLLGRFIDTFVVAQLRPEADAGAPVRFHHLRLDDGRREIDLIAEYPDGAVAALEIKASAAPRPRDARHLDWLAEQLGDRFVEGIVFHTGPRSYRLTPHALALPISAIWT